MNDGKTNDGAGMGQALSRYLRWVEVIELTGMSRSTLKRAIREGEFPAPRTLTRGRVGFRADEIAAWSESRQPAIGSRPRSLGS